MSKKDYQALATAIYKGLEEIRDHRVTLRPDLQMMGAAKVTAHIADALAADSPRFDRDRFIEACETGTTKGMKKA